ncbi:MAG: SMC-Scp complex subunit ScpB [Eubacterium sp.]|nr:SMC-Scp complex subunit ScpB [Eubacterium sp.]
MDNKDALKAQIESILFTMGESVEVAKIAKALEIKSTEVRKLVKEIQEDYKKDSCGLKIIELEDSYQMCTKPETYEALIKVAKQPKRQVLTDVLMETLSIIAYKQPVTKSDIERIRGVKCDFAVNKLMEYELVCELGRLEAPGRPLLFGTTEEFLRRFGVQNADTLPTFNPEMIDEFKNEAEEEVTLKSND